MGVLLTWCMCGCVVDMVPVWVCVDMVPVWVCVDMVPVWVSC